MNQTGRMPQIDVHGIFDRFAHLYDTEWVQRALYAALQDAAMAELRAWRPASVLDVACGTGIFADRLERQLAPGAVTGCDLSAGMLAQAVQRSRAVCWVRGDSAALPFQPGAFDAVACTMAFHFFDQTAAWAEFHRVLAPGGHAAVGMIHPRTQIGSDRFSRLSTAGSKTPVRFPTAEVMRHMALEAGFEAVDQSVVDWRFGRVAPLLLTVGRAVAA